MHHKNRLRLLAALAFLAAPATGTSDDWPQWRGPRGDNVSREAGWSSVGREAPLWRANIGTGYSAPVVAGGRLYIAGYFEDEATPGAGSDRVSCFDAATGEVLWTHTYPAQAYANEHAGGALSTPTLADDVLYVPTRGGEVRALSVVDGVPKWEVDLVGRHAVSPGRYGYASSPFLQGEQLVLNAARTVALDRATGATVWISEDYEANYSTVAPIRLGERDCLAVFGAKGLVLVDAATGEHVHTYVFRKTPRNVEGATPIVMGTRVFVSTAYEQGGVLVDFAGDEPEELWRTRRMRNKMAGCTLQGGHLYGFDESMLKCIDLSGKELWRVRGLGQGALSIADGRLLLTTSKGELVVAQASPEEYRELSRRDVIDGGVFWTAPLLANGLVYVRGSLGDLVCLDHRAAAVARAVTGDAAETAPEPAVLVERHLKAAALADREVPGLHMTGRLQVKALGLEDVEATWESGGGRWHTRFGLPPGMPGFIELWFDGERGWEKSPFGGDKLIEGNKLEELRRTSGMSSLFTPLPAEPPARTVGRESFQGTDCYRVDVRVTDELVRKVYFDAKTGLLAGRTSDKESTVVFGGWRKVGEVLLPHHRTVFDSETGQEQRWRFTEVVIQPLDAESFVIPEKLLEEPEEPEEGDDG